MRLEGQQLDQYQIISIIGSGGMGDVYLAEDTRIGQQVAVKVIWTEQDCYSDAPDVLESGQLLRREARAISQLDHPRILPLYNYGETQIGSATLVYLVMPYRPEGSLTNWIRQEYSTQQVPPEIVADLIKQAAEALQEAHDHQIVHQDIKPSNFLIRTQAHTSHVPELLLTDFGIAHIVASSSSTSHLGGTPVYMAPEQCQGKPVFASDQYALAVMTYELLTGRPPFQGNAVRLMYQHMTVTPEPPSTLQPQLSRELDAVLLKALQKRPEDRFASVTEFAESFIQTAQLDTPAPVPKITRTRRHGLGRPRWRVVVVSVLLSLLLLLGGVAYAYLGVSSARKMTPRAAMPLATITITPASKDLKQTYTLSGVIGTPDANKQQVQARQISGNTQASSTTVDSTGQVTTVGTNATGSVTISNPTGAVQNGYSAGATFTGSSGVTVVLDTSTPMMLDPGTSYTELAHAIAIGTAGNIPALDINTVTNECRARVCVKVVNNVAFTGGTNSGTYAVVQQSDIDGATNSLLAANHPDPQKALQGQMRSNEQLVGTPQCQSSVSANHQAGEEAAQVTVSLTFTCTGEVYDKQGAQALSTTLLTHQATMDPGTGYTLVGRIKTAVSEAALDNQGTVTLTVTAEGVWVYQFSQEQQRNLARLVAGKSKQVAISLLQEQQGVFQVAIQLADGAGQTLSANLERISVVVGSIPGA